MKVAEYMQERAGFLITAVLLAGVFGILAVRGKHGAQSAPSPAVGSGGISSIPPETIQDKNMSRGSGNAKVTLVQYSDFLCPSCSYVSLQVMPSIMQKYVEAGRVDFEFRPMAFIAPGSRTAYEGAYCAIDQGKFWQYHDAMYGYVWDNAFSKGVDPTTTTILTVPIVKQVAASTGLESGVFDSCLDKGTHADTVRATTELAQRQGVTSTPYIMVNGQKVRGDVTLGTLEAMIKTQL